MRRTDHLRASPPMFESAALDRLTRVHHRVPVAIFAPAIAALGALAVSRLGVAQALALALGGWVAWTLTEYWVHRVVFHFEPEDGIGARLHWMVHGVHHDHPNDPLRLVMPPAVSVPLAAASLALFWLALGRDRALAVECGFAAGYLVYDVLHYSLHHNVPRSRLGRRLRALHMRHHFEDHEHGFGISAPWWDRVFGTATPRER